MFGKILGTCLICLLGILVPARAGDLPNSGPGGRLPPEAAQIHNALLLEVEAEVLRLIADPEAYSGLVKRECARFPEGDLFPFTLPAMALSSRIFREPGKATDLLPRIRDLLRPGIRSVERKLGLDRDGLGALGSLRNQATYVCQLDLALGYFELAGGRDFRGLRRHLSGLILTALQSSEGRPLQSFPGLTWTFDTIPCLAAVHVAATLDQAECLREELLECRGSRPTEEAARLARVHYQWLKDHAWDPETDLPQAWAGRSRGGLGARPRGCELSWRIPLTGLILPEEADRLLRNYISHFWIETSSVTGFAEWPGGRNLGQDGDSGPVLNGVGMAASGLGMAAVLDRKDHPRAEVLLRQVLTARATIAALSRLRRSGNIWLGGVIPAGPEYVTGFLYGDLVLLYTLSWTDLPRAPREP